MYLYQAGYGTMEESSFYEFKHEKKFSTEEFWSEVTEVLKEVAIYIARENIQQDILEFKTTGEKSDYNTEQMQRLFDNTQFDVEMGKRGFTPLVYDAIVDVNGWSNVYGEGDNNDDWGIDEREKKMHIKIRQGLYDAGIMFDMDEKEKKEKSDENR